MSKEDFEGIKEHAKQVHGERVAKNGDRIQYAIDQLAKHDLEYTLKNSQTGHFHCHARKSDALIQFWAGTGKILLDHNRPTELRGIHNLIRYLETH
jgi:hypothetical protein